MMISKFNYLIGKYVFRTALKCFYRKIEINGMERIPGNQPVLFVANHCNAVVDALLLSANLDRPVTLTAKKTLLDNPVMKFVFNFLSVVYLSRRVDCTVDKAKTAKSENMNAMYQLRDVLHHGESILIFPEGKSHSSDELMPFKTGAARLALEYADEYARQGKPCDLVIVPVGLRYEQKELFRSSASLTFGYPLDISDCLLSDQRSDARILTDTFRTKVNELLTDDKTNRIAERRINPNKWKKRFEDWEQAFIATPFSIFALVLNLIPFLITRTIVTTQSTDDDHPASTAVVIGPMVFGVFHIVVATTLVLSASWFALLLYSLLLVPCSINLLSQFDLYFREQPYS